MKTDIKYIKDINAGDFAIVHKSDMWVNVVEHEERFKGGFAYATSKRVPFHSGRVGRVKDANYERRISGLDALTDIYLVLTSNWKKTDVRDVMEVKLGGLKVAKHKPSELVLIDNEQEIRGYFAQYGNHYFEQLPLEGRGWLNKEEEIEKQLKRALEDYQVLHDIDLNQDIPEAHYLFLSRDAAEETAKSRNECAKHLRAMDNYFREAGKRMNDFRIGSRI